MGTDLYSLAGRVRSARIRRGLSRETLASEARLSFAAVAQIEAGRRREIRVSTLEALSEALGVSMDYLSGRSEPPGPMLEHAALTYASDDEFVDTALPFVEDGVDRAEDVLVVTTEQNVRLLRRVLGRRTKGVRFAVSEEWYSTPIEALHRYRTYVNRAVDGGCPWIRVIGEPMWSGRGDGALRAWVGYESIVNLAFASTPATIICPYDERRVPPEVLIGARRTHPYLVSGTATVGSDGYLEPESFLLSQLG